MALDALGSSDLNGVLGPVVAAHMERNRRWPEPRAALLSAARRSVEASSRSGPSSGPTGSRPPTSSPPCWAGRTAKEDRTWAAT